ncbi:MAG: tRNA-2-methylthio-N6-dimethylallyladenosine synthase [Campylobacterota bacterium]|nr:tRNA-2-methylthio-N6-dimethylallyladenosine synthase [Campylobacterota bacterium]
MNNAPKLFIETLGCAMNVRDSEHMIAELQSKEGYVLTDDSSQADLILINTCSVREKPVSKLFSELGQFNKIKKNGAKIGVCGCTASHLGKEIIDRASCVDFVLGARNVSKITKALYVPKMVDVDTSYDDSSYVFEEYRGSSLKANINISIGCDKECTYCIVPHTRGEEISIPSNLILDEVKKSADRGVKEIYLLGQNVNNYGRRFSGSHEKINFPKLLNLISEVDGIQRISFTSPHPLHVDDEFIDVFANNPKITKHMHLPLQSGSSEILKAMKRGYSKEWFLEKAFKLREIVPNFTISTEVIVGFPGESDKDFEDTIDVVKKVKFEQMFSFKYSPRPLTKAAEMTNIVDSNIADERLQYLQNLHRGQLRMIMASQVGKTIKILFEELKPNGRIFGRSNNFFSLTANGSEELLGLEKDVLIIDYVNGSLEGKVIV